VEIYTWDPEYREAFDRAFQEAWVGPFSKPFKVTSDPSNRMFVDGILINILDGHRIASGQRWEGALWDEPKMRAKIKSSAEKVCKRLQEPRTEISTDAFLQMIRDANNPNRTVS
jgi:hypothetical protein